MPIKHWDKDLGKLELYKWEKGLFEFIKIRKESKCYGCDKTIKKGCYCLGGNSYNKICLDCANRFCDNFNKSLNEHKKMANKVKEYLEKNKGEMMKNNVINSV